VGNDANSGKSPDQPMASLAALLRAYPITAGDTIFVDTGNYVATSDAVLPASDGGTAAAPALIIGPTNGGAAVINRNNTAAGTDVLDDAAAGNVTVQGLVFTGADDGIDLAGAPAGFTLLNDTIYGNSQEGIYLPGAATVNGLAITGSAIHDNSAPGISLQGTLVGVTLTNDLVYDNASDGIDMSIYGQPVISGGAVYGNSGTGISVRSGIVEGVTVHGNTRDGIDGNPYYGTVLISGNTVYANGGTGISSPGTVTGWPVSRPSPHSVPPTK